MKKPPVAIRIVVLVSLIGLGIWWYFFGHETKSADQLTLYGNVDIREVQMGFRQSGRLKSMFFEEGDSVEAGDLLAIIDNKPYTDNLKISEAQVQQSRAQLDRLLAGSRPQEIQQAKARVQGAIAELKNAKQDLERQQDLIKQDVSSQKLLDAAIARKDWAESQFIASKEAFALSEEGTHSDDIAAAQAALAVAVARLEKSKTQLEDTQLYSPSAGVILSRVQEPGAMVAIAQAVYTLSLQNIVYVRAYVAEPYLGRVVPGTVVKVISDGSNKNYQGNIGFVSPRAEFTPKSVETPELRTDLVYRLRIVVTDPDDSLRQGMPVTVKLSF